MSININIIKLNNSILKIEIKKLILSTNNKAFVL